MPNIIPDDNKIITPLFKLGLSERGSTLELSQLIPCEKKRSYTL